MSRIADILIEQGRAAADARRQSGALWGQTVSNLSQVPGQIMADRRAADAARVRAETEQQRLNLAKRAADREETAFTAEQEERRKKAAGEWAEKLLATNPAPDSFAQEVDRAGIWTPEEAEALKGRGATPEGVKQTLTMIAPFKATARLPNREIKTRDAAGNETIQIVPDTAGQTFTSEAPTPKPEKVTFSAPQPVMIGGARALVRAGSDGNTYDMQGQKVDTRNIRPDQPPREAKDERLVQIMGPNGSPIWVRESDAVNKPVAQAPRAVTGAERQVLAFYNRANDAVSVLTEGGENSLENKMAKQGIAGQQQLGYEGVGSNYIKTKDQRRYRNAQRSFTEARLRKESGAAIPESEFENDRRTYFVQGGDDEATVKQKAALRQGVLDGLKFSSGKAYDEFYGEPNVSPVRAAAGATSGAPKPTHRFNPATGKVEKIGG